MGQSYSMRSLVRSCFLILILVGCSSVSQETAEQTASDFVRSRVVPYATGVAAPEGLVDYELTILNSVQTTGDWHITLRLSASVNGTVKDTTVEVTVNSRTGKVTHFNGNPVQAG